MPTKKQTIVIEEVLKKPFEQEGMTIHPFQIGENIPVPMFGETSVEMLKEFANLAHQTMLSEPLVVFWGLSGNLGNFYSPVLDRELTSDTLDLKIKFSKTTQPFMVHREKAFELLAKSLGGIQSLREIPFEEAMLIIDGKKPAPQMQYEELEDDDDDAMTENCLVTCRPGYHKCGK